MAHVPYLSRGYNTRATFTGWLVTWLHSACSWNRAYTVCATEQEARDEMAQHKGYYPRMQFIRAGEPLPSSLL